MEMLRASICHNDDDPENPKLPRVPLFYDPDAHAWVNHETNKILFRVPNDMTPKQAVVEVYGAPGWDLRIND
jgi:hypothetical protein